MRVSSVEANSLRSCHRGTILSINSFVSTSLSSTVAMMYLGADPDRDIMLEILVDKTLLDSESSPFANIRAFSAFPDEEEVLLSMGITLQVQSVTSSPQTKNMNIQARLCYEEDTAMKELKAYILNKQLHYGQDESYYMNWLVSFLLCMGDQGRMGQITKRFNSATENTMSKTWRDIIRFANLAQQPAIDLNVSDTCHDVVKLSSNLAERFQNSCGDPRVSNCMRDQLLSIAEYFRSSSLVQNADEITNDPKRLANQFISIFHSLEKLLTSLSFPSSHPYFSQFQLIRGLCESVQGKHVEALKHFETGCVSFLDENHPLRRRVMIAMAESAAALDGDDDCSLRILEDLHTLGKPQAETLVELAKCHERLGDLPMAIAYYRAVIDDCNLPPNSTAIVDAYCSIGSAFHKLNDIELALSNYYRARELLLQHHPPTHPISAELQRIIPMMESIQRLQELLKRLPN